jgi:hypothetical protein
MDIWVSESTSQPGYIVHIEETPNNKLKMTRQKRCQNKVSRTNYEGGLYSSISTGVVQGY